MQSENLKAAENNDASIIRKPIHTETAKATGLFTAKCYDKDGILKWEDVFPNIVTTVGKNLALDTYLAGTAYTVTGPFLGLISSLTYTAVAAADTMTSHTGWVEAGATNAPTYTAPRKTAVFSAAATGSKALSVALSFAITSAGTVKGCFLTLGTGAVSTIDNTGGTLYSAGLFAGGDKICSATDTLQVSYTASL